MGKGEYKFRRPGWLKDKSDTAALTEIIVEGMYEDGLCVLQLKIENFCEDRNLSVRDIKQSIMASIAHGIYKGLDDAVITSSEKEYFFAFLDYCNLSFDDIPISLQRIFKQGLG